jgi:hypothetical protein
MMITGTLLITKVSPMQKRLHVRDINTGHLLHTLVHSQIVMDMVLVPAPMTTFGDGMLVTGDSAGHFWLWDVHTGIIIVEV